jgi:hypothetical protein
MTLTTMQEKPIKRTKDGMRVEYDLRNMTRGKYAGMNIVIVGAAKSNEYQPRIVASGEKLLSRTQVSREVKERRGGSIDE